MSVTRLHLCLTLGLLCALGCCIVLRAIVILSVLRRPPASPSTRRVRCIELFESPGTCHSHRIIYLRLAGPQSMKRTQLPATYIQPPAYMGRLAPAGETGSLLPFQYRAPRL